MRHEKFREGRFTKEIESRTAKLPSGLFLAVGLGALAASISLKCMKRGKDALFVGQFAAPLLIMAVYDKIVKTEGHD